MLLSLQLDREIEYPAFSLIIADFGVRRSVVTVTIRGSGEIRINWSGCGAQDVDETERFALILDEARAFATQAQLYFATFGEINGLMPSMKASALASNPMVSVIGGRNV